MFNYYNQFLNKTNEELDEVIGNYNKVDYNAFYRAYVVDNNDLDSIGRVKVRIPTIHGIDPNSSIYVESESLPWASPGIFNSAGNDSGSYLVPNVGDMVFVTFEGDSPDLPIYFGGIPLKAGVNPKRISSTNINDNNPYEYTDDDLIKDVKNGTERVIYKSLKGATIYLDDFDGKEFIRIIDATGQEISMENYSSPMNRRGDRLGLSDRSKIAITNNQGDKITLKNNKVYVQSSNLVIETTKIDMPGINRNFSLEADLTDVINGIDVIPYDSSTDSNAIKYGILIDKIIGMNYYKASNKNIIDEAISLTVDTNGEIISSNIQTNYSDEMITLANTYTEEING